ncbi:NADPH-dependent FMN reductase [Curtobacterium sp. MCBD17_019]|uniref:NADPH-dependent FMN reductase n=1 Tax=Curtobacterium sp. MCBD17_019 TaxID=2175669 RepID=UPI000DAA1766|nr:NAD(P)H-dependent oxidoreductase [Curtobacterium sp. MCBD17_019]PZE76598.1 NADPH-dependent oxidoreductase [Curtobacterium sp. MCBD17_019]
MITTVVVGNPKPASHTLEAATVLAERITGSAPDEVVDVITLGAGLLGWGDPGVQAVVETVAGSDLVVVASPTFKATYTGVLKLFLDQFATGEGLAGVTAVPLMLGAGPAHHMAPDVFLKPVLVELGATTPTQGLYLNDKHYGDPSSTATWLDRWRDVVLASAAHSASPALGTVTTPAPIQEGSNA